jgi:hypothetical protein
MKDQVFLVLNPDGIQRMTKKAPKLAGNERSVAIAVNVPDKVFEYTFMKAEINIDEDQVIEPELDVQLLHANDAL